MPSLSNIIVFFAYMIHIIVAKIPYNNVVFGV